MGIPVAETPPEGLCDAYWLGVWRHALKCMKEQGSWAWELRPLLDEYVFALMDAVVARDDEDRLSWDRSMKRAMALADQLALTPRGRKAAGVGISSEELDVDPFAALDELSARRAQAS
jgi:hypothetical protein